MRQRDVPQEGGDKLRIDRSKTVATKGKSRYFVSRSASESILVPERNASVVVRWAPLPGTTTAQLVRGGLRQLSLRVGSGWRHVQTPSLIATRCYRSAMEKRDSCLMYIVCLLTGSLQAAVAMAGGSFVPTPNSAVRGYLGAQFGHQTIVHRT